MQLCRLPPTFAAPACTRGTVQRRRGARCAAGDKFEAPHKRSIEEIAGQQYSAAEPGGELGWQDPGVKPAATHRPELAIDAGLRSALQPLLLRVRAGLAERHGGTSPRDIGMAAVAAAEASGALPPLAGPQRVAVEAFFSRLAEDLGPAGAAEEQGGGFEKFGSSGGEALFGEEDVVLRIRPQQAELLEMAINYHLGRPSESAKAGGEVGNIALQSDTQRCREPRGNPAQSESDQAERRAEAQFEQLELADNPHASAADLAAHKQWEQHWENKQASAAIEGDAPAAGGGLQVIDSPVESRQVGGSGEPGSSYD